jgi:hypothetical protein
MLARAVKDLKISTDKFAAQILTLEDHVKHLENKVVDGLNVVSTRELCLECTTRVNDDYKEQNAQLTKKLESKSPSSPLEHHFILKTFFDRPRFVSQSQMLSLTP